MFKKDFFKFIFVFVFVFVFKIVLGSDLYNYDLKQYFIVNNEKYFISSYGYLFFKINKNSIDIKINKANYVIYKEIDNELIKISANFYQNINSKINEVNNIYKSENNIKFDSYFYPFYYVSLVYNFYKREPKIKINDNRIPKKVFFNNSILLINLVDKKKYSILSFKEIYKNEIINIAEINLNIKDNEIDNIKMNLRYNDLTVNKELSNNNKLNIGGASILVNLKRINNKGGKK